MVELALDAERSRPPTSYDEPRGRGLRLEKLGRASPGRVPDDAPPEAGGWDEEAEDADFGAVALDGGGGSRRESVGEVDAESTERGYELADRPGEASGPAAAF